MAKHLPIPLGMYTDWNGYSIEVIANADEANTQRQMVMYRDRRYTQLQVRALAEFYESIVGRDRTVVPKFVRVGR